MGGGSPLTCAAISGLPRKPVPDEVLRRRVSAHTDRRMALRLRSSRRCSRRARARSVQQRWSAGSRFSCFNQPQHRFSSVPIRAAQSIDDPGWGWSELTLQDRQGRWWIPTGRGLLQFAAGPLSSLAAASPEVVYYRKRGLPSDNILPDLRGLARGSLGGDVRRGGQRARPRRSGPRRAAGVHGAGRIAEMLPIVHAFAEDFAGNVWVGLEEGRLLRYRGGRFDELVIHPRPGPSSEILRPTTEGIVVVRRGPARPALGGEHDVGPRACRRPRRTVSADSLVWHLAGALQQHGVGAG